MLSHVLIDCTWVARRAASGKESRAASATLASRLYGRYLAFIVYLVYEYVCTCMQVFVHTHINPRYPAGVDHSPADSDGRRTERHFAWSFSVKDDIFPPSCFGGFSRHYLILQGLSLAGTPVFLGAVLEAWVRLRSRSGMPSLWDQRLGPPWVVRQMQAIFTCYVSSDA